MRIFLLCTLARLCSNALRPAATSQCSRYLQEGADGEINTTVPRWLQSLVNAILTGASVPHGSRNTFTEAAVPGYYPSPFYCLNC